MKFSVATIAGAAALVFVTGSAHAASINVDIAGWFAGAGFGALENTSTVVNIGAGSTVTGFSFSNLEFSTEGDSWLSELVLSVNNDAVTGWFDWAPSPTDASGTFGPASGFYGDAVGSDGPFGSTGAFGTASGDLFITTYLTYTFPPVGINLTSGTLTINYAPIPEPSTYGMMALGLLGVAAAARRRKA